MMHEQARALIEEQYVGSLEVERSVELRAHLRGCAPCRAHYDRWAAMEQAMGGSRDRVARLLPLIAGPAAVSIAAAESVAAVSPIAEAEPVAPIAKVEPVVPNARVEPVAPAVLWPRRGARIAIAALALAAAVLFAFFLVPRGANFPAGAYQVEIEGGEKEWRGAGDQAQRVLSSTTRLTIILSPTINIESKTEVELELRRNGDIRRWRPETSEADHRWRLSGLPVQELKLEPGAWQMEIRIGPSGDGPQNIFREEIFVK
jgi:hypothetical protein